MGNEIRDTGPDYYERIGVAFEFPNFYSKFSVLDNLKAFVPFTRKTEDPMKLPQTSRSNRCRKYEGFPAIQGHEDEVEFLSGVTA